MLVLKKVALAAGLCLYSTTASAAILVNPPAPTTGNAVTIRVENTFGAQAQVTSATITQSGNIFVIQQNVEIACTLPSNPVVASEFQVGPLAAGAYAVTANITFTGIGPLPCSPAPVTQTSTFNVISSSEIPAISGVGLLLLAATLTGIALIVLKSST